MNKHKFFPIQEPQPEEMDEAFVDTISNLLKRFDTIVTDGILPADSLYATTGDNRYNLLGEFDMSIDGSNPFILNIGSGLAFARHPISDSSEQPYEPDNPFDLKLERVFISPSDSTPFNPANPDQVDVLNNAIPKSTGHLGILLEASETYYVYVAFLPTVDTATNDPSNPGNKYTINPRTGHIDYVHWVDGYRIKILGSVSGNTNDVYLGTVTTNTVGIASINIDARRYMSIPAALSKVNLSASVFPATYAYESTVSVSDHINAVGDVNKITPANPHGTTIEDIPGGTALGMYVDKPEDLHTNGIVDWSNSSPGPYFPLAGTTGGYAAVWLTMPVAGQDLFIYGNQYSPSSEFWSEVRNDAGTALEIRQVTELGAPVLRVDFPPYLRASGYYLLYAERYVPGGTADPGLVARAVQVTAALEDLTSHPGDYLGTDQFPIAVCWFNGTTFVVLTDPQTGYTSPDYKLIDVRLFGTIGPRQYATNKRFYTSSPAESPERDVVDIAHNVKVKDLTVEAVEATTVEADSVDATVVKERGTQILPPGTLLPYVGSVAPAGYFLCDGSVYSRTTYAALFAIIGTSYGNGTTKPTGASGIPGAGMFNVPDLRGAFLRGVDGSLGRDPDKTSRIASLPGGNSGNAVGSLQPFGTQDHGHLRSNYTWKLQPGVFSSGTYVGGGDSNTGQGGQTNTGGMISGTPASETRPVNIYVNYIIRY